MTSVTNKYYLDFSVIDAIPEPYRCDSAQVMSYSGKNIGNFAFRNALRFLTDIDGFQPVTYTQLNEAIDNGSKPSKVIMSCANWIGVGEQVDRSNGVRADLLERFDCPVTVFGLGAQAPSGAADIKLGPNTIRLVKTISARSQKISVRDNLTRDVFAGLDVHNVVVTGCPSNFINGDPRLGTLVQERAEQLLERDVTWGAIRTHLSEFSGGHAYSGSVLKFCLELMSKYPALYVLQSPVLLPFLFGESTTIPPAYRSNLPNALKVETEAIRTLKSKVFHFTSIDAWMDFARTCDVSLGMRIHGNMIPLQSGIPSVVISHDSRTEGLASIMGIPNLSASELEATKDRGPKKFLEQTLTIMAEYDSKRRSLAQTWKSYLSDENMPVGPSVKAILAV